MKFNYYIQAYMKWMFGVFFGAILLIGINWLLDVNVEGILLTIILFALVGLLYPFIQQYIDKRKNQN
ncbi:membrane protein implicated in regulation of membrane protease activity [Geomicrobium halophilum]|uniref:Membrane protein implicated in regulation of membrane protease activity n=1 Tax=Geomicrobium halophilum TaxID=549000 RepID=A0A841PS64_9BACL|nr:hypothetical protein [Geomicrobium halophilum]MBB6450016.1 membrane protein implicated in regulation of membrane protease activity [Geomicrobium halophilum]